MNADQQAQFLESFGDLQREVHRNARDKGFWDNPISDGERIALMHSELSEMLEGIRMGNPPDDKIPQFSSAEAELADVIIRAMDMAQGRHYRLAEAILAKMAMNRTREPMHGGKLF